MSLQSKVPCVILPEELLKQFYSKRKLNTFALGSELSSMSTVLIYRKGMPQGRALKAFIAMY